MHNFNSFHSFPLYCIVNLPSFVNKGYYYNGTGRGCTGVNLPYF